MKFEIKYPNANPAQRYEFEHSYVSKTSRLRACACCSEFTRWIDVTLEKSICSEECGAVVWKQSEDVESRQEKLDQHFAFVKEELEVANRCEPVWKDILIIVRNQLSYVKECIESVRANTKNFRLLIWDNGSRSDTKLYLESLMAEEPTDDWEVEVYRHEQNLGFIEPNNTLAALSTSPYLVLLNSDCKVFENWDRSMIGFLREHPEVAEVGYVGGLMGADGKGFGGDWGWDVDYIPGWCFCISRETYQQFGLFNKQLLFAYCEDADFSLRLKEAGKKIYALHSPLVFHHQNKTIKEVQNEGEVDVVSTFEHNHEYMRLRWKDYIEKERVMLKKEKQCARIA